VQIIGSNRAPFPTKEGKIRAGDKRKSVRPGRHHLEYAHLVPKTDCF